MAASGRSGRCRPSNLTRGKGSGLLSIFPQIDCLPGLLSTFQDPGTDGTSAIALDGVLVLSNLGLIFADRSWKKSALLGFGGANRSFVWIALATLALLGCVLGIPEISRLFAFITPTGALLLVGAGAALLSLLRFEAVKSLLGRTVPSATDGLPSSARTGT